MRAEGVTDYIALPLPFIDGSINASSWTTKQPGGFTDELVDALREVIAGAGAIIEIVRPAPPRSCSTPMSAIAPASAFSAARFAAATPTSMHAAIWLSDLRGFTALSDRLPAETVVDILNLYFDCQVSAIRTHGGEVLKFMGDGLLAVFPIDEYVGDVRQVCCARAGSRAANPAPAWTRLHYPIGETRRAFSLRCRAACRKNPVRQYRRRQPARLHLYWSCREPRGAAGKDRQPPPPHDRGVGRICRHLRRAAGATSANFRSPAFQRPSASTDCSTNRRRRDAEMT